MEKGVENMNIIFFTSIILSLLHSILFWDRKPGISVFIFTLATVGYLIYVLYKKTYMNYLI